MNPDFKAFMHQCNSPARLTGEQVGWRLGLNRDEVRIVGSREIIARIRDGLPLRERHFLLSRATRLHALGTPSKMAVKYFCEAEITRLESNTKWLNKAVRTIREFWILKKRRNGTAGTLAGC